MNWNSAKIDRAQKVLAKGTDVATAARKLGCTVKALERAFDRAGLRAPTTYCGPRAVAPVADPLTRAQAAGKVARLSREHAMLVEQLREANGRAAVVNALRSADIPTIKRREPKSGLREGTAVVLASDWHVEESVTPEQVAGRNVYNLQIAEARADRFFVGTKWLLNHARASYAVRDLVLWLGGDLITGYIHPELAESNELSPVEALLFVQRLLTQGIQGLLADPKLEQITIPCSFGNHGRTTEKRRIKTGAKNSFEWLLYNQLQDRFRDEKRLKFVIDQSAHQYVDAYDFGLHFHHGDEVRYQGGVGGLAIPLLKRVPSWDRLRPSTYHHIGHFHQVRDFHRAFVNGSLIGYSEYAVSIGADFEPPQQLFYLLDSRRGACLKTPIWVDEDAVGRRAA